MRCEYEQEIRPLAYRMSQAIGGCYCFLESRATAGYDLYVRDRVEIEFSKHDPVTKRLERPRK